MSLADSGQILIGQIVYETLSQRSEYMRTWKAFSATVKHGVSIPVYQYVGPGFAGLNIDIPKSFEVARYLPQAVYTATDTPTRSSRKGSRHC
ncbi:MAG: hypothetical protein ACHBNF_07910 [Chromatiales bacterium]